MKQVASESSKVVIRAEPNVSARAAVVETGFTPRRKTHFDPTPRRWVCFDVDDVVAPGFDIRERPGEAIAWLIRTHFPAEFQNTRILWQLSSSAGVKDAETIKVHVWAWLSRPLGAAELKGWRALSGFPADEALFRDVQVHYVANPSFIGAPDPCAQRWGILEGELGEIVVPAIDMEAAREVARERGESLSGLVAGKDVAEILSKMGDGEGGHGFHAVIISAQMKWARTTPPAFYERQREGLKKAIRDAARSAPRRQGRSLADVERDYLADDILDKGLDGAIRRVRERRTVAEEFPRVLPLAEAEETLKGALRRFFGEGFR